MKGLLHPNGEISPQMAITDALEDGSGGLYLLRRNWKEIWAMTAAILKLTAENQGNLLLTHGCARYNKDICPFIARKFVEYLENRDE